MKLKIYNLYVATIMHKLGINVMYIKNNVKMRNKKIN